ncbi:MAG TPA: phosphonate C-P lyase system protein PhnG [Xanthobacteraceae bacterium]|nr:phosphonate C-P lyase system protein PhnG [Xanthobacteraceae bacterium]
MMPTTPADENGDLKQRRQQAMAALSEASAPEMARLLAQVGPVPEHHQLRKAESGLIMMRGRIGGDGAPFNLGEVTVSRAAVQLASGEIGFGYVLGRDKEKAQLIAYCDALMQRSEWQEPLERVLLAPIRKRLRAARAAKAEQAAATKVEFFTLVRGED